MYIIDLDKKLSIIRLNDDDICETYINWIMENKSSCKLAVSVERVGEITSNVNEAFAYFGFTLDSYIDNLLGILPAKSADSDSNRKLLETILSQPNLSKSKCCSIAGKSPTHFTRLAQTIRECSRRVANVTGGRDPVRLLEFIRVDF